MRPNVFYEFADPALESASAGRKLLLRMGEERRARQGEAAADKPIKMTVPGPFTMAQQAQDDFYGSVEAMAMDHAAAVNAEIKDLFAAGADFSADRRALDAGPSGRSHVVTASKTLARALDGVTGARRYISVSVTLMVSGKPSGYSFLPEFEQSAVQQVSVEAAQPKLDGAVLTKLPSKTIILGVHRPVRSEGRDAGDCCPTYSRGAEPCGAGARGGCTGLWAEISARVTWRTERCVLWSKARPWYVEN